MNKLILLLGLTILYYILLFQLDKYKKAAFKKATQQAMGKTAILPIVTENSTPNIFGSIADSDSFSAVQDKEVTLTKEMVNETLSEDDEENLQEDLEELIMDLEAEQTFEVNQENHIERLKLASTETIKDEEITGFIQSISKNKL